MAWRGQISKHVQCLRFHVGGNTPAAQGTRNFIQNQITALQMMNPSFAFQVRDNMVHKSHLIVTYDWNMREWLDLAGLSEKEVADVVAAAVEKGRTLPRSTEADFVAPHPTIDYTKAHEITPIITMDSLTRAEKEEWRAKNVVKARTLYEETGQFLVDEVDGDSEDRANAARFYAFLATNEKMDPRNPESMVVSKANTDALTTNYAWKGL